MQKASQLMRIFLGALILAILISACGPSPSQQEEATPEPAQLKVVVLPYISYAPFFIAQEEGYFAAQGLEVEFIRMDKTSDAIPALAQGQVDVASGLMEVSTLNAIAKGTDLKYVGDKGYLAAEGCTFTGWTARKDLVEDGTLDDLQNLARMNIAFSPTSSAEYALDMLLKDEGLSSADVNIMDIPPPTRHEGLGSGSVDISAHTEPWVTRSVKAGYAVDWLPWQVQMPDFQLSIIMYGPNLLVKDPDLGNRFMLAYLGALQQYNEGKTDRNVEIVAQYTQMDPQEVRDTCWIAIRPDASVDLDQVMVFQDWAIEKGYLDEKMTQEVFWDGSFLKYANQALKESQ